MEFSPAGYALLNKFEGGPQGGYAARPYRCPAGHLTVGWGHRLLPADKHLIFPLTEIAAQALLKQDVASIANRLAAKVQVPLTQGMADALISLAFNIGSDALLSSTLLKKLNSGDYLGAADEFLRWDKATNPKTGRKKEALAGLTKRRQAERALFLRDGVLK